MKDIDFDELDRAVSSVLGHQKPGAANGVKSTKTPQTAPSPSQVVSTVDDSSDSITVSTTTRTATPLAAQRRGKFMDVMHPSADMSSQAKPVAALPEHTAPSLAPLSTDLTPEKSSPVDQPEDSTGNEPTAEFDESHSLIGAEPTSVADLPEIEPVSDPDISLDDKTPLISVSTEATDMPDDIEEPRLDGDVDNIVDQLLPDADINDPTDDIAGTIPSTPFLTDTKVDKRPLGGFQEAESADSADESTEKVAETPVADLQSAPEVPLPRELQSDVVEVESAHEAGVSQEAPIPEAGPFAASVAVASETSDDGRVEGHPLFDTSTYHEPMTAVQHGGTAVWLKWALGLAICLVIGAGVGFFLFSAGI